MAEHYLVIGDYDSNVIKRFDGFSSTVIDSITFGGTTLSAVTHDATDYIVADRGTGEIVKLDGFSATELSSFSAPGSLVHGLTWDATNERLISSDYTDKEIHFHDGFTSTITSSFSTTDHPYELSNDGTNLYCQFDNNSGSPPYDPIYKFDGFSSTVLDSFYRNVDGSTGSAWGTVNGNMYSSSFTTDIAYELDGFSNTELDSFDVSSWAAVPVGMTWDDNNQPASSSSFIPKIIIM